MWYAYSYFRIDIATLIKQLSPNVSSWHDYYVVCHIVKIVKQSNCKGSDQSDAISARLEIRTIRGSFMYILNVKASQCFTHVVVRSSYYCEYHCDLMGQLVSIVIYTIANC